MELAIRSQDLKATSVDELIEKLIRFDIDGLQLVCYKTFSQIKYEQGALDEVFLNELQARLKVAGKKVYLIGAYFNPVHSNIDKVKSSVAIFKEYLVCSSVLGCNIVGSETGSFNDDKWTFNEKNLSDKALSMSADRFRELCDYALTKNAFVGIEGAAGHVAATPDRLFKMLKLINRDNIKVIFDLYNYLNDENHLSYIDILKRGLELFDGRLLLFHIKDYIIQDGKIKQVPVGRGIFDYKRILTLIKAYDKNAVLVLEGTVGEDVEFAVKYIKGLWNEIDL